MYIVAIEAPDGIIDFDIIAADTREEAIETSFKEVPKIPKDFVRNLYYCSLESELSERQKEDDAAMPVIRMTADESLV